MPPARTLWDVDGFNPQIAETWDPLIDALIQRHEVRGFEVSFTETDGTVTHWAFNGSPIYNGTDFLGYRGTAQDISLQKGIEQELRDLNARKDKFFSIIAHDLRSPFTSLMGAAGFFRDGIHDVGQHDAQKLGTMMYDTARRACNLVDDLLQWSRLQLLNDALRPEPVDLGQIVAEVFELIAPTATAKGIDLSHDIMGGQTGFIDRQAISTIMRNLVGNAVKFTPADGRIIVAMAPSADDRTTVLTVADTGVGMPAEKLNERRMIAEGVSTKGTNGEQGTGLGLALCDELVTKSNGTMQIKSAPGDGTKVSITIPTNPLEKHMGAIKPAIQEIDGEFDDKALSR